MHAQALIKPAIACGIPLLDPNVTLYYIYSSSGDNNYGDDRLLYAQGQLWLQRHHIMGRAVG